MDPSRNSSYDELLASGIKAIAAKGADRITVSDVTSISHHSRPTFYTYFGDMNGFLAEIWLKYGLQWLDSLISEPYEEFKEHEVNQALIEILIISHRNPEIAEVLFPDFQKWFEANAGEGTAKRVMLAWYLSVKLGMFLSLAVNPQAAASASFLKLLIEADEKILEHPKMLDLKSSRLIKRPAMKGIAALETELDKLILASAIEVVANSGIAAASMARIARKARVSTGTLYPRFKTTDILIAASFDQAILQIVQGNVEQLESNVGPDEFGSLVVAGFEESRKSWRNYRLELYLESMHNEQFAKHLNAGLEQTRLLLDGNLVKYGYSDQERLAITHLMQNEAVGISLLFNAGIPVVEMDHRIPPRYIQLLTTK